MHTNFLALSSYFSPIIFIASKIGFGATVLIVSQIENAAYSIYLENRLRARYDFDESDSDVVPSKGKIKQFLETLDINRISFNRFQILESIYFYHQSYGTKDKSFDAIVKESLNDDSNSDTIFQNSAFLDTGKKSDLYGLMRVMSNIFYDSVKRSVNQHHLLSKAQLDKLSSEKLGRVFDSFNKTLNNSTENDDLEALKIFLFKASKNQLKKLGINGDSYIFRHREEFFTEVSEDIVDFSNEKTAKFIDYLKATMKDETIVIIEKECDFDQFLADVPKDKKKKVSECLKDLNPINQEEIKKILIKIDEDLRSAEKSSARITNFIYGTELAPYPRFLVRDLIQNNDYDFLNRLTIEHSSGIKGVYAADREEIFSLAYYKDKSEVETRWRWIKLLIKTGFEFGEDHKKALFRDIMEENDTNSLDLLLRYKRLNLFDYQKDRGITFYHLLLIDASEYLMQHVYERYSINQPGLKVKFIPNYPVEVANEEAIKKYWEPHENNFKLVLPNFGLPGMKIRKNWDFLMVAAGAGRREVVRSLIDNFVDTSGYENIKDYLKVRMS